MPPIKGRHLDLATVAECGKMVQSKVNPHRRPDLGRGLGKVELDIEVPTAAGILAECGGLYPALEWAGKPQAAEQNDDAMILVNLECSGCIKGHPAKIALFPRSPGWATPMSSSGAPPLALNGKVSGVENFDDNTL
ncbi:MAG: hypothetical protein JO283_07730 [Bradyrhizobium sp.]|nr:hypothetical protein [Bradyrhizobium sp.]